MHHDVGDIGEARRQQRRNRVAQRPHQRLAGGELELALPDGVSAAEAITWNASFEEANGLVVSPEGGVRFTGILRDRLTEHVPALRDGFPVRDLEAVCEELLRLRAALMETPPAANDA